MGHGARSLGIANVYVYDGKNVFLISRWDEFGAGVQKILVVFHITKRLAKRHEIFYSVGFKYA